MTQTLAWSPKEASEYLDYQVNFNNWLNDGELIVSQDAVAVSGGVVVDRVQQSEGSVLMWIAEGTKGQLAHVLVTAETNAGRRNAVDVVLPII